MPNTSPETNVSAQTSKTSDNFPWEWKPTPIEDIRYKRRLFNTLAGMRGIRFTEKAFKKWRNEREQILNTRYPGKPVQTKAQQEEKPEAESRTEDTPTTT